MRKSKNEPHAPWNHLLKNGAKAGDPTKAPRCGAKTRSKGACKGPAMPNGRCRMHGGKSTGPKTLEGKENSRRASLKHGEYSITNKKAIKIFRDILRKT